MQSCGNVDDDILLILPLLIDFPEPTTTFSKVGIENSPGQIIQWKDHPYLALDNNCFGFFYSRDEIGGAAIEIGVVFKLRRSLFLRPTYSSSKENLTRKKWNFLFKEGIEQSYSSYTRASALMTPRAFTCNVGLPYPCSTTVTAHSAQTLFLNAAAAHDFVFWIVGLRYCSTFSILSAHLNRHLLEKVSIAVSKWLLRKLSRLVRIHPSPFLCRPSMDDVNAATCTDILISGTLGLR
ncbi:uncharacterized protein BDR25DRAFT_357015 [Lindgomyces ingoldianus]|uniref:Uncharacterized protein n=1 Tax=Lindgomyces ingoldianus TaxID=673940 RepID=A0ACB6QNT1_9PLEO|nr:uncharacterized protein BDR25DRAFT_357015 [Lindgomyces ingoldianus]KAF2468658.1 hypothetical protein BDR25DRAFT_357015 [Lindgomyces ingoldianus]